MTDRKKGVLLIAVAVMGLGVSEAVLAVPLIKQMYLAQNGRTVSALFISEPFRHGNKSGAVHPIYQYIVNGKSYTTSISVSIFEKSPHSITVIYDPQRPESVEALLPGATLEDRRNASLLNLVSLPIMCIIGGFILVKFRSRLQ